MRNEIRLKELLEKYLNDKLSANEKTLFYKGILNADNREEIENVLNQFWKEGDVATDAIPSEASRQRINRIMNNVRKPVYRRLGWYKVAAAILAGTVVAGAVYFKSSNQVREAYSLTTKTGERKKIALPDGTTVWLNAASTIVYNSEFNKDKRVVELQGEAFFEVAQGSNKPFIVNSSNNIHTLVVGTSFNIKDYNNEPEISVAVASGKVKVMNDTTTLSTLGKDARLVFTKNNKHFQLEQADNDKRWNNGYLIFNNDSLEQVIVTLNRTFGEKVFASPGIPSGLRVRATFEEELGLHKILELICKLHDLEYTETNNQITLYKHK